MLDQSHFKEKSGHYLAQLVLGSTLLACLLACTCVGESFTSCSIPAVFNKVVFMICNFCCTKIRFHSLYLQSLPNKSNIMKFKTLLHLAVSIR